MDVVKIIILSAVSLIELFILTKLMGNRELSQLTMFDYVVGITIGSIAAEMSTALESEYWQPMLAMLVYAVITIAISYITSKSIKIRRIVLGKSRILLDNGKLYRKNFKKSQLDINEFLIECRNKGYFNLSDIQTAILESNGKISIIPNSLKRPVTPEDLNLEPIQEKIVKNVILDGKILKENLQSTGHDENWLKKQIKEQGIKNVKDIFLATVDDNANLSIYTKFEKENKHDNFE